MLVLGFTYPLTVGCSAVMDVCAADVDILSVCCLVSGVFFARHLTASHCTVVRKHHGMPLTTLMSAWTLVISF